MSKPEFEDLVAVMRNTFGQPNLAITRDTSAEHVPGWDSLNHAVLMLQIEEAFGVSLAADETAQLQNVGELFDMISARAA